jgi:hypothetical protein
MFMTTKAFTKGVRLIMTHFSLFETEPNTKNNGIFLNAGLLSIANLYEKMGLPNIVNEKLHVRSVKGYSDSDHILSQILLQIGGGSALDHLDYFNETFHTENCGVKIPSPSAARDYMNCFHNENEDAKRGYGMSFVPEQNEHLKGFADIHYYILHQAYKLKPVSRITLDQDATFINSNAEGTLCNYKGERSYEALNIYCPEYDIMVATQFRDGNVTPGYGQLEQLKELISNIPEGVKEVYFRSDTAGYQVDLLKYCAGVGEERRFPVINFTVSCPVGKEFKQAVRRVPEKEWKRVYRKKKDGSLIETKLECAEVVYVPNLLCRGKNDPEYRFIATREFCCISSREAVKVIQADRQKELELEIQISESMCENMKKLHLTVMNERIYKVFGIVTNRFDMSGSEVVLWHHGRCGKSEEVHRLLKDELAGGHVISKRFGANAAYWNVAVMALSVNNLLKNNFLPSSCRSFRPKTLRFMFYNMAGRFVRHAHKTVLKLFGSSTGYAWFMASARQMEACFVTT